MRTINLTVIGDRACSTTRTYLAYLRAAGIKPLRLWLVDFCAPSWRVMWARRVFGSAAANRLHRWEKPNGGPPDPVFAELCNALQASATPRQVDLFGPFDAAEYAAEVESFAAANFDDPYLQRRIIEQSDTAFLYTNGGRVPGSLLDRPNVRVFHVHPGIVPDVRGSDCLLWSYLARGRFGVSCFYMSAGIDEGAVISQREFDVPDLNPLREHLSVQREETAYRALLFAVDPHFRARLFADVMSGAGGKDLRALPSTPQGTACRPAYLWMHPQLRRKTMLEMTTR